MSCLPGFRSQATSTSTAPSHLKTEIPTAQSCTDFPFINSDCLFTNGLLLVLKLPLVHIPGFHSSAMHGPGPNQQQKDLPQGY